MPWHLLLYKISPAQMNTCIPVGEIFKVKIWQWIVEFPLKASRRCMPNSLVCLEKLQWILFRNILTIKKKIKFEWYVLTSSRNLRTNDLFSVQPLRELCGTHKNKSLNKIKSTLKCPEHSASIPIHTCFIMMTSSNWTVISCGGGLKSRASVNSVICETWFLVTVSHLDDAVWQHELQWQLLFLGSSVWLLLM